MDLIKRQQNESIEEYVLRIGYLKETGNLGKMTWDELAIPMSRETGMIGGANKWRKHYARIKRVLDNDIASDEDDTNSDSKAKQEYLETQKKRVQLRDERQAYKRAIATEARYDSLLELFREEIHKVKIPDHTAPAVDTAYPKKLIAMLSDIHYGISFENRTSYYDSKLAIDRVLKYAYKIIDIAKNNNIKSCVVPLMGDLISGNIHTTLRIENRENVVEQTIAVSELIAEFIEILGKHFDSVHVYHVPGNHSRTSEQVDAALNGEKLDIIPFWYSRTKLEQNEHIYFHSSEDPTMAVFDVCGKTYVAVHGDHDPDATRAVNRIERIIGGSIECLLTAHMHTFEARFAETKMIRNGSVIGSGDEYTQKLRLKSDPYQVVLICGDDGIESIHPVLLN